MMLIETFTSQNIDIPKEPSQLEYDIRHLQVEERSYGMRLISGREDGSHGDLGGSALSLALAVAKTARSKRQLIAAGGTGQSFAWRPSWNDGHRHGPAELPDPDSVGEGHVYYHSMQAALNAARQNQ